MRVNIVNIVSKSVKLTKLGPAYTGICPFCGASGTTDFRVSVQYQKYTCDKCGASGGIFQFLLNFKNLSLEEALNEVKETFNIPLDGHLLDSRWNEFLKGTDFQQMLNLHAQKSASLLNELAEKQHPAKEEPISFTALATFIRCPLEYKLRYRDKIKAYEPAGTHVNLGRFLHSVASQFLKLPFKDRNSKFIELQFQSEIDANTNKEYIDELGQFREPTTMLLLENFADKRLSDRNPHFKTRFGLYTIVGTTDCLIDSSDGIKIIEFKEYDYRDFEDDSEILHYLQLLFYYFGLRQDMADITGGRYYFFNNGNMDNIAFTTERIDQAKIFIQQGLQELDKCTVFKPKLNRLCISCGYNDKCELQGRSKRGTYYGYKNT